MLYNNILEWKSNDTKRFVLFDNKEIIYLKLLTRLRAINLKAIVIICLFTLFIQNMNINKTKYETQDKLILSLNNKFTTIKPIVLYNPINYLINETYIHEFNIISTFAIFILKRV